MSAPAEPPRQPSQSRLGPVGPSGATSDLHPPQGPAASPVLDERGVEVLERAPRNRTAGSELSERSGRVVLVGAGPGDPELLTLRGLRALREAEVIVADRLGARPVLDALERDGELAGAEIIDVGKRPGHHPVPQPQINELLVELARAGRRVVRLKGGDPYVFGRGGEEVGHLRAAGIEVVVVPGVSAVASVPALAGIPLTHRGVADGFTVVAGHDWLDELPGGRDHTVVLLMGIGTLEHSARVLAGGARGADCPVAVIEDGYGPGQRVTIGTLGTIAAQAAARGIRSPATVVVGDVVSLSPYSPARLPAATLLGAAVHA